MTGRRLYDKYADAAWLERRKLWDSDLKRYVSLLSPTEPFLLAWPFLTRDQKDTWSRTAKSITPKPKPKPRRRPTPT